MVRTWSFETQCQISHILVMDTNLMIMLLPFLSASRPCSLLWKLSPACSSSGSRGVADLTMSIQAVIDKTKKVFHSDVLFPIIPIDHVSGLTTMVD